MFSTNHILSAMLFAGCIFSLSACATNGSHQQVGSAAPLDCAHFVDAGSPLSAEIATYKDPGSCEVRYGPQGGHVESFGTGGIAKGRETDATRGGQTMIMVNRYYDWDEAIDSTAFGDISDARNFKVLSSDLPISLAGAEGPGRVTRFEASRPRNMTVVCVTGIAKNPIGSRTLVELCRPVGMVAGDHAAMAKAREIATSDFASINP